MAKPVPATTPACVARSVPNRESRRRLEPLFPLDLDQRSVLDHSVHEFGIYDCRAAVRMSYVSSGGSRGQVRRQSS